jgi:acid phosphatase (class A)
MNRLASLAFAAVFAAAMPSNAETVFQPAANPALLLPPPPADGSPAAKAEMDELHRIEASRTPADFAHAMSDDKAEDVSAFAAVMGPRFDLKALPKTAALFADLRKEEKEAATQAKNYFKRNRPWVLDPALKSCARGDKPQSSYPSGHATMGYSFAVVLAALAPEKADAIMARASDYAESRLICGMHYRRDIVAGQVLGTAVAVELMALPAFKTEFDAARDELRAAHVIN